MKAVASFGPEDLRLIDAPDPVISAPTDAVVRVTTTALCGADLFPYHGYVPGFLAGTILGHEYVGVVESIMARLKMDLVPKYILTAFALVFFAVILTLEIV